MACPRCCIPLLLISLLALQKSSVLAYPSPVSDSSPIVDETTTEIQILVSTEKDVASTTEDNDSTTTGHPIANVERKTNQIKGRAEVETSMPSEPDAPPALEPLPLEPPPQPPGPETTQISVTEATPEPSPTEAAPSATQAPSPTSTSSATTSFKINAFPYIFMCFTLFASKNFF